MKKNIILLLGFLSLSQMSCKSNLSHCKLTEIKTLFNIPSAYEGTITGYSHYVLLKDFSRDCIDSTTIVNYALKYMDSVSNSKPISVIKFFNSTKKFIPNETSQIMEQINKDCLVTIGFDVQTRKPNDFIFYNDKGEIVYWGNRWIPFPKANDVYRIDPNTK